MPQAAMRQMNLLFCVALLFAAEARASSAAQDELTAARLIENTVMTRIGDRREHPTEADRADMEKLAGIYEQLLAKYPDRADVRNAFANYLWFIGRQPAAFEQWQSAEKIDPKNTETAYRLGECELAFGQAKKAVAYFSRASQLEPKNAFYHLGLGNALFLFRKESPGGSEDSAVRALAEFRQAAELEPFNAEYLRSYAETFYGLPRPDWPEALKAWSQYLEVTDKKDFAYSNLARVNLKLGRKKEAQEFLKKIESKDYDHLKSVLLKQAEGE